MQTPQLDVERAVALHRRGQLREAEQLYRTILQRQPQNLRAAHGLGVLYLQYGRAEDGEVFLRRAVQIDPRSASALCDLGRAFHALKRISDAVETFDRALALDPQRATAWYQRGNALHELGRAEEAIESYDRAIARNPAFAEALNDRGNVLRELNRLSEALASYARAAAAGPGQPLTWLNLGFAQHDAGQFEEALASYNRAIALDPDFHPAYRNRGTLLLLQGRLREGFADFEHRLASEDLSPYPRLAAIRRWSGEEELRGKSIAVYSDGAFGDLAQFCRYLPMLTARGARVSLLAPARFRRILSLESLGVRFAEPVDDTADYRCEIMSLPFLFQTGFAAIPPVIDHLAREPARIERWRAKLPARTFNIGICWQGNPARHIDRGRSIPLIEFLPLSQISGVRLVSLQKHHGLEQLRSLPVGMAVETPGRDFDEGADAFVDTAAVMASLDLIVTSDTAIAHLAAALGRPTWIALRRVPEWRWFLERDDSPWYPFVRLFRQKAEGEWRPVFHEIAAALRAKI